MKNTMFENTALQSKILSALCMLDEKGGNEYITKAMSIVYEAFHLHELKQEFSSRELFMSSLRKARVQ